MLRAAGVVLTAKQASMVPTPSMKFTLVNWFEKPVMPSIETGFGVGVWVSKPNALIRESKFESLVSV